MDFHVITTQVTQHISAKHSIYGIHHMKQTSYITYQSQYNHQNIQILIRYLKALSKVMNTQHGIINLFIAFLLELKHHS